MVNKISIREYFEKGKFIIPNFQRGYKWSVVDRTNESSLKHFVRSLKSAFENKLDEYFIEAVTIVEENCNVLLIDGQQRTTSLFLILTELIENKHFLKNKIEYTIRKDSHNWLNNLVSEYQLSIHDEDVQDIHYFKIALIQIREILGDINKQEFKEFIYENVNLLYNIIPADKAVNTFVALNGLKAIMKDEELIKSELLIKSSRFNIQLNKDLEEQYSLEWKINEVRGQLARNWDKWLYWWNQNEVKLYFGISNVQHPLYYLLITYWNINSSNGQNKSKNFCFDNFKLEFVKDLKATNRHFEGLRKLQKTFEDLYNNWERFNLLGLAFNSSIAKKDSLHFFIKHRENMDKLNQFVKWSLADCTITEIKNNDEMIFIEKRDTLKNKLGYNELFLSEQKRQVYIQLLRMNVLDMNHRKFDFEVFKTKSLEHICPQNPLETDIAFNESQKKIEEMSDGINSIGNLVLLNGSTNSALSNKSYDKKKQLLFNKIKDGFLLPHTLKVFSKSFRVGSDPSESLGLLDKERYWTPEDVINNKNYFFTEFDNYYGK